MPKQPKRQRKVYLAGTEFIGEEITRKELEELKKLDPELTEWEVYLLPGDDKYYKVRRTRQYLQADKLLKQINKEQKELGIDDWLNKNKPGLAKDREKNLKGNARIIYYNFRIEQELFENEIITRERVRKIVFGYLRTEKLEEAFEALRKAKKELEELRKKPISPEEAEDSFQRLLQRDKIIADPKLIKDLPMVAPSQLDKRYLVEETETSTEIIKKYKRRFGNKTVTYVFLIPKEEYKKGQIPTFGEHFRKVLLSMSDFAVEQKTLSPVFRKEHIFRLEGKADNEIKGGMYESLDNVFKTIAYVTYEIENDKKGKEYRRTIGHITDSVDWIGKGRGSFINPTLNRKYFNGLAALIEGKETDYQYLLIPKDRLTERRSRDEENFLNYIDALTGLRNVYPIKVKTLFVEKLGYSMETLRKMGSGKIMDILTRCLELATTTGRLRDPSREIDYMGDSFPKNVLNWKIKLFLSRRSKILT